jgi:hypothetical protein
MNFTFARITSGFVGGLVLSYVLFMGYLITVAQQSHTPPSGITTTGCFSLGHCPVVLSSRLN